jgi:hypothetical protein
MFRVPAEALFIFCFVLAVLAGYGFSSILSPQPGQRILQKRLLKILAIFSLISVILAASVFLLKEPILSYGTNLAMARYDALHPGGTDFDERYLSMIGTVYGHISGGAALFSLFLCVGTFLVWLRLYRNPGRNLFLALALVLIIADLWAFSLPGISLKSVDELYPDNSLFQFLKSDSSRYRILDLSGFLPQQALPKYGIESITGYDPMLLRDYMRFTDLAGNISDSTLSSGQFLTNIPLQYLGISQITNPKILSCSTQNT